MNIRKILTYIAIFLGCIIIGVVVIKYTGLLSREKSMIAQYEIGNATFCQLDENERFVVCPKIRELFNLDTGGQLVNYVCNEKLQFIETKNLTPKSKTVVQTQLVEGGREENLNIKEVCKTPDGVIYKITMEGVSA